MKEQLILVYSYLYGLWQYRWAALAIACVVAITGWVIVFALPNQYTAQAVVHVDTTSVMTPLLRGLSVESEVDTGLNMMKRVLLSRKNLEDVIRQTDMDLKANTPEALDDLVQNLARKVSLTSGGRRKGNNIYELSYEGSSPEIVYQIVSKLLNTLIEHTLDAARTDTAGAQKFLDQQIEKHELRLTIAEQKLAEFKRANVGYMPDAGGGFFIRLQNEERVLDAIRAELLLEKRRYSAMLKQLEGELPLIGSGYGTSKVQKLRRYREQLDNLLTQYEERHPDIKALRATIADLIASDYVEDDVFVNVGSGDSVNFNPVYHDLKVASHQTAIEIEALNLKLAAQQEKVNTLKKSVDLIPGVEAGLAKLNRDYEVTRERFISFIQRRESAQLAQAVGQSGSSIKFRIIEPPRIPTKPSAPNRLLFLTLVFLVALAAGLGWGFLKDQSQPTFINTKQLGGKVGVPLLGSVRLHLSAEHKRKRQLQLMGFLVIFSLLAITYGVAMVFSHSGSELVNALIESRSSAI